MAGALTARRRLWIMTTAIATMIMFTWTSFVDLAEVVEAQRLPAETPPYASPTASPRPTTQAAQTTAASPKQKQASPAAAVAVDAKAAAATAAACGASRVLPHTDFWGDALGTHDVDSAEECCRRCSAYVSDKPLAEAVDCNVWVWCGDAQLCGPQHRACWLKHLPFPDAAKPASAGPAVGWTTGIMAPPPPDDPKDASDPKGKSVETKGAAPQDRSYHVIITAQGAPVHWLSRVCYYWYRKVQARCQAEAAKTGGAPCDMGGFTRILHSGLPDDLVDEIPTFVADPLPPEHPDHGYVVLNRPYAILQWVKKAKIKERYVLMSEPDHMWLRPLPNPCVGDRPAAFPFFYIEPAKQEYIALTRRFATPEPVTRRAAEAIAPIGNAPTLMTLKDLAAVAPLWFNLSIAIHNDAAAVKAWGWVQEMYAFTIAVYNAGVRHVGLHLDMMAQPPWDDKLGTFKINHLTYGMDYDLNGTFTPGVVGPWRFDKRSYHTQPPPRGLDPPPPGMRNELVRAVIDALNEATEAIPGWDAYRLSGMATPPMWDGKTFLEGPPKPVLAAGGVGKIPL